MMYLLLLLFIDPSDGVNKSVRSGRTDNDYFHLICIPVAYALCIRQMRAYFFLLCPDATEL